ncbi:hypothetical protein FIBSPDRAFT_865209 [Athelia psychrophila]|uniref:Uncharacterized protein n=1 Tax=Athelia psychrophila TaxID=1759441 RepID=A0A166FW73_9AGAM|nr:hypothetical protein FIBSPDRAFT_865209 [Fibularhizoctonia sp. CBS 109695]
MPTFYGYCYVSATCHDAQVVLLTMNGGGQSTMTLRQCGSTKVHRIELFMQPLTSTANLLIHSNLQPTESLHGVSGSHRRDYRPAPAVFVLLGFLAFLCRTLPLYGTHQRNIEGRSPT